ncbi:PQQ-dependent sugar dehydrogenase [Nitrospirillum sp. BR 11828]|uniref:PQQ-dependent sugar dehydrogenase n=1 Tax=Nitrospirillum sp. BR 11828 TaxID=3104325 RepID=UPI002ACA2E3D|nr:PQQ-dependent sugar dehydrogenase [Nitrospirillum sp. BR 11828]MDZ5647040.1 PQQ-dependent sugar dehydrogenase [Nitrospirillum sp. BR 11828]
MRRNSLAVLSLVSLSLGALAPVWPADAAGSKTEQSNPEQKVGQRIQVRPADLPAPYATEGVGNVSEEVARPAGANLTVPKGFTVSIFATGLSRARNLAVAPNGDVFLARQATPGEITLLRDSKGTGQADQIITFAGGFDRPYGIEFHDGYLWVGDIKAVWKIPYREGDTKPAGDRIQVTPDGALGQPKGHPTRSLEFAPDGKSFFVGIGSMSNIAEDPQPHATVTEFNMDGTVKRVYASGTRNPVGLQFYPGSDDLYAVVNERDGLGDGLVPDYFTRLQPGGFYGWPYSYIGSHPQPDFADKRPDLVAKAIVPDLLFDAHSAPLGLLFYTGHQFPADYQGGAFVTLHGSWNKAKPTGYKIVYIPFTHGRPAGHYVNFATGFWLPGTNPAQVWGRPVGLAMAHDGSLLVADDVGGTVWRISYHAKGKS